MRRPLRASEAVAEGYGWTDTPAYRLGKAQLAAWHRECAKRRGGGIAVRTERDRAYSVRKWRMYKAAKAAGGLA